MHQSRQSVVHHMFGSRGESPGPVAQVKVQRVQLKAAYQFLRRMMALYHVAN